MASQARTVLYLPISQRHAEGRGTVTEKFQMSAHEVDIIREIGQHRAVNRFYRTCYNLLKELQEVVERTIDDLLLVYHSEAVPYPNGGDYRNISDIAGRLKDSLERLEFLESAASDAWNELWNNNP